MFRRDLVLAACMVVLAACGSVAASPTATGGTVGGVGVLPPVVGTSGVVSDNTATAAGPTTTSTTIAVATTLPASGAVGSRAPGNRVILIGDSVMASTSSRYTNDMCNALVPLGWQVEVDAEVSRFIDFGTKVLDQRLSSGWDVSVILLGNNYGQDQAVYSAGLESMVERLSPNPVVLLTVTKFDPSRQEVNDVIRLIASLHPNVTVMDWNTMSTSVPGLLGGDGLHLTPSGRHALAENVAATMGQAPLQPGSCLTTKFKDDSAGNVNTGSTIPTKHPTATTVRPTATTVKATGTTVKPGTTVGPTTVKPGTTVGPTTATTEPPVVTTSPATATATTTRPATTEPATTRPATLPPPVGT
jgi:hypothetical protein